MIFRGTDGLRQVIDALDGVRRSSNGYSARCPGHEDQHASLSVRLGDNGKVVFNCHAWCSYDQIVGGLGITPLPNTSRVARKPLRSFHYQDRDGTVVASKHRRAGRGSPFYWSQPDGTLGLDGESVGLYRLPQVIQGVSNRSEIWLAEGERDAETLAADGVVATTGPHGAKSWLPSYSEPLAGAYVKVVADRDKTGIDGARRTAAALTEVGCTVNILVPPLGYKDVTDLYEAGFSRFDLVSLDEQLTVERIPAKFQEDGRPFFAMQPVTWFSLDPHCFKLASFLDYVQGAGTEPHRGEREIAAVLGMSRSTVDRHLEHLVEKGVITITQVGRKKAEYRINNPSRKSGGPSARPPVDRPGVHQAPGPGPSGVPQPRSGGLNKFSGYVEEKVLNRVLSSFPGAEVVDS